MARPNPVRALMNVPLPSLTEQRLKCYRPDMDELDYTYKILNKYIFNNELAKPPMMLGRIQGAWGMCLGHDEFTNPGTLCEIRMSDKWFCMQWMVATLAHEMAHQYEWDVIGDYYEGRGLERRMTHRQAFFLFRERMAEYDIVLKTYYGQKRWFKYQNFYKC